MICDFTAKVGRVPDRRQVTNPLNFSRSSESDRQHRAVQLLGRPVGQPAGERDRTTRFASLLPCRQPAIHEPSKKACPRITAITGSLKLPKIPGKV